MITITLICAAGLSTSMLMERMKEAAEKRKLDVYIQAMPESKFQSDDIYTDILLLGPQVSYLLEKMKKEYESKGIRVLAIDMIDYGMMDGDTVLTKALTEKK